METKKTKKKDHWLKDISQIFGAGANNLTDISHAFWLYTKQEAAAPVWAARLASPQEISWDFQEALEVTNVIFHSSGCCSCFHGSVLPSSMPAADPTHSPWEWQLWLQPSALQAASMHALFTSNSSFFFSLNPSIPIRVVKRKG